MVTLTFCSYMQDIIFLSFFLFYSPECTLVFEGDGVLLTAGLGAALLPLASSSSGCIVDIIQANCKRQKVSCDKVEITLAQMLLYTIKRMDKQTIMFLSISSSMF